MQSKGGRKVLLPNVESFGELFETWTEDKAKAPRDDRWAFKDYDIKTGKRVNAYSVISSYCVFSGVGGYRSLYVKPRPALVELVKKHCLPIAYDSTSFKVVVRDDGTALVCAENSKIIGGSWVALIPIAGLPPTPIQDAERDAP